MARASKAIPDSSLRQKDSGDVRIGISGWRYKGWRGDFYPPKLAQRRELEFAGKVFSTIEINGTFYSLQRPASFAQWSRETPDGFIFSLKGSRFITHMKKLRNVNEALANYFAQGVLELGPKLGPVLWQFPPTLGYDHERFEAFFQLLPRTTREAAAMAAEHSPRPRGRVSLHVDQDRPLRHCVEIRHTSFVTPAFVDLLRRQDIGLVVADSVEWPMLMDVTSDFVYCRLHGADELYASGYDDPALDTWAERVRAWASGGKIPGGKIAGGCFASPEPATKQCRDVFVYFDNDAKVRAPYDALGLIQRTHTQMRA